MKLLTKERYSQFRRFFRFFKFEESVIIYKVLFFIM